MNMGFDPIFNYIIKNFVQSNILSPEVFEEYFRLYPDTDQYGYEVLIGLKSRVNHQQTLCLLLLLAQQMEQMKHPFAYFCELRKIIGSYLKLNISKLNDKEYLQGRYAHLKFMAQFQAGCNYSARYIEKTKVPPFQSSNSTFVKKDEEKGSQLQQNIELNKFERKQFNIPALQQQKIYLAIKTKPLISPFNQTKEENTKKESKTPFLILQESKIEENNEKEKIGLQQSKQENKEIGILSKQPEQSNIKSNNIAENKIEKNQILITQEKKQINQLNQVEKKVTINIEELQVIEKKIPHTKDNTDQFLIRDANQINKVMQPNQLNQVEEKVTEETQQIKEDKKKEEIRLQQLDQKIQENKILSNQLGQFKENKITETEKVSDENLIKKTPILFTTIDVTKQNNQQLKTHEELNQLLKKQIGENTQEENFNQTKQEGQNFNQNYQTKEVVQKSNQNECTIQIHQSLIRIQKYPNIKELMNWLPQLNYFHHNHFEGQLNPFKKKIFLSKFIGFSILEYPTYKILLSHKNKFKNENSNQILFEQLINLELNKQRNQLVKSNVNHFHPSNYRSSPFSLMFLLMLLKLINRGNQAIYGYPIVLPFCKKKIRFTQFPIDVKTYQIKARETIITQENYWSHKVKKKNLIQKDYGITDLRRRIICRIKSCCHSWLLK